MHSTASDGTNPPQDLAALARAAGLSAIALTDHDTTTGLAACGLACENLGLQFVPGIELSADPTALKLETRNSQLATPPLGTLHILGLFIRDNDPELLKIHERLLAARLERNPQIIRNLQALGVNIEYDEVVALAEELGTKVIGRPHIAQVLVNKRYVKSVQDAFARYLGEGKSAYARKDTISPTHAIEAIHHAGGLAILAHPIQLRPTDADELDHIVTKLADMGLDGIETRHSDHTPADVERYTKLARRLNLLTSGGSDYHGQRKSITMGSQSVPMEVYESLRDAWRR